MNPLFVIEKRKYRKKSKRIDVRHGYGDGDGDENRNRNKYILKLNSEETKQELQLCKKIAGEIPHFFCYFSLLYFHGTITSNTNYIVTRVEDLIPFFEFFGRFTNGNGNCKGGEKEKLVRIIHSYNHLCDAIQYMKRHDILHGKYGKIGFNTFLEPVFYDFSPLLFKRDKERESESEDFTMKGCPIEMYILHYLYEENRKELVSLSIIQIKEIVEGFCKEREKYGFRDRDIEKYEYELRGFINKPKREIIEELWKHKHTWDNYMTSMLFLELLFEHGLKEENIVLKDFFKRIKSSTDSD